MTGHSGDVPLTYGHLGDQGGMKKGNSACVNVGLKMVPLGRMWKTTSGN